MWWRCSAGVGGQGEASGRGGHRCKDGGELEKCLDVTGSKRSEWRVVGRVLQGLNNVLDPCQDEVG